MSLARDLVYSFAEKLAKKAAKEGIPYNGRPIEPGSRDDDYLHGLLNQVEDDRVHAEVHRILDISMETMLLHGEKVTQGLGLAIKTVDPYKLRNGELRRKSDGKVMLCERCPG